MGNRKRVATFAAVLMLGPRVHASPGDLDATFGDNGFARELAPGKGYGDASALFQQADGKLLVGRTDDVVPEKNISPRDDEDLSVMRYTADGEFDSSFDGDGRAWLDIPDVDAETAAVIQQVDGKIVAVGSARTSGRGAETEDLAVARYLVDGRADPSFGNGGFVRADDPRVTHVQTRAAVQQSDGKLVTAGFAFVTAPEFDYGVLAMLITRLDTAGFVDAGFGTRGLVLLDASGGFRSEAHDLAQQSDGKLLVAGVTDSQLVVVRLTPEGVLDAAFGDGGVVKLAIARPDHVATESIGETVRVQGDGKIVVTATVRVACGPLVSGCESASDVAVVRLDAAGRPDPSFGAGGTTVLDFAVRDSAGPGSLVIGADGSVFVGGDSAAYGAPRYGFVARLSSDGLIDAGFGDQGASFIDTGDYDGASAAQLRGMAQRVDGRSRGLVTESAPVGTSDARAVGRERRSSRRAGFCANGRIRPGRLDGDSHGAAHRRQPGVRQRRL